MPHPPCTNQMAQLHNIELLDVFSCTLVEFIEPFVRGMSFVVMDASTSNNPAPSSYCCCLIFVSARFPVARCMPRLYCTFSPASEIGVPACLQPNPPATIPSACSNHPFCVHALGICWYFVISYGFWGFAACAAHLVPPSSVASYITQPPCRCLWLFCNILLRAIR